MTKTYLVQFLIACETTVPEAPTMVPKDSFAFSGTEEAKVYDMARGILKDGKHLVGAYISVAVDASEEHNTIMFQLLSYIANPFYDGSLQCVNVTKTLVEGGEA